jgi:exonuclease VII small subunit
MAELGETNDPRQLIAGDADSVTATAQALRTRGEELHEAGAGLQPIDTAEGWSGAAGDAFRAKFRGQPGGWLEAGDCFDAAADALDTYVTTLTWAQARAADAIRQWNAAEATSRRAMTQHQQAEKLAVAALPFEDPGEVGRDNAQAVLDQARDQLERAGTAAATAVGSARDKAPKRPGFWSKVGDAFSDVGANLENLGGHVLNGLASLGNAAIHHPGDMATAAVGAGLMVVGAAGDAGGGLLDLTGVGAVAGVPINVVSTAAIAAGGGLVVGAAGDLVMHAASDDSVSPGRTDHTGGRQEYEPAEGFRGSEFSKDEIVEFINGHTGDADPTMARPSPAQVEAALTRGTPTKIPGRNAEEFDYEGIHVVLNYDMPWRSSSWFTKGR